MAKFIEADVIQKIATEAEWLTQTRIPYQGQIMIVGDSAGKVTNIKVGDGVNPFADLNYMFDSIQQNAQYVPITSNALPTPVADPAWGMVTAGTYTFGGIDVFTVPDGHWGVANYSSGVWSLVDMGEVPGLQVADNLTTPQPNISLSANMGVVLGDRVDLLGMNSPGTRTPVIFSWEEGNFILRYESGVMLSSVIIGAKVSEFIPLSHISGRALISSYLLGQQASAIVYYASDNESSFISSQYYNVAGETDTRKGGFISPPAGANFIRVGTYDVSTFEFYEFEIERAASESDVLDIKARVNDFETKLPKIFTDLEVEANVIGIVARKTDGTNIISETGRSTSLLPIDRTKNYEVTVRINSNQVAGVAYYATDQLESYIGYQAAYDSGQSRVIKELLIIPENANYWRFSTYGEFKLETYDIDDAVGRKEFEEKFPRQLITGIFLTDGSVNKSNGTFSMQSSLKRTDFLPVSKDMQIHLTDVFEASADFGSAVYFFNRLRRPISHLATPTSGLQDISLNENNIPDNAYWMIVTTNNANQGNAAVEYQNVNLNDVLNSRRSQTDHRSIELASEYDGIMNLAVRRQQSMALRMIVDGYQPSWYGIEWDEEESNPDNVTRIGSDMELHNTLPIQSKMRRCVTKDGFIQYYLDSEDSTLKEDGTSAILDGTDGDVMVEVPEFYFKSESTGTVKRLLISEEPIPGYQYSARRLTSAFEATAHASEGSIASVVNTVFSFNEENVTIAGTNSYIQASSGVNLGTQKTASIIGYTVNAKDFRGGDGSSIYDDIIDTNNNNVSLNCLGRPLSGINRESSRVAAALKGNGALTYQYDTHRALWILSFIEIAQRDFQRPIAEGGFGMGATMYPNYNAAHSFYGDMRAIIPNGTTLKLGNNSGEVYYNMKNVPNNQDLTEWVDVWMPVMSYRGVENFYGHQYKIVDQVSVIQTNTVNLGNDSIDELIYFYQRNPYLTTDRQNSSEMIWRGMVKSRIKNIQKLLLGDEAHMLPIQADAPGYTTYYADCVEIKGQYLTTDRKYLTFSGRYVSNRLCGPLFVCSERGERIDNPDYARRCNVTRLDYILR